MFSKKVQIDILWSVFRCDDHSQMGDMNDMLYECANHVCSFETSRVRVQYRIVTEVLSVIKPVRSFYSTHEYDTIRIVRIIPIIMYIVYTQKIKTILTLKINIRHAVPIFHILTIFLIRDSNQYNRFFQKVQKYFVFFVFSNKHVLIIRIVKVFQISVLTINRQDHIHFG